MFFEAMLASGVAAALAKLMYAGVYWGGPRWSQAVVDNTQLILNKYITSLGESHDRDFNARGLGVSTDSPAVEHPEQGRSYRYDFHDKDLDDLDRATATQDLTMDEIERLVDQRLTQVSYIEL